MERVRERAFSPSSSADLPYEAVQVIRGPRLNSLTKNDASMRSSIGRGAFIRESFKHFEGRYELAGLLAKGRFGSVFSGVDLHTKERVGIKKICTNPKEYEDHEVSHFKPTQLKREVDIMKQLNHSNVGKLIETYQDGNWLYLILELCEGGDLQEWMERAGGGQAQPFPEDVGAKILMQVARALHYVHGEGIAHRDLKTDNICFIHRQPELNEWHIKVIDWNVSNFFGNGEFSTITGTQAYMAPEILEHFIQGSSASFTKACDLWSLGVVSYALLSGKRPFWAKKNGGILGMLTDMRAEKYPMSKPPWDTVSSAAKQFIQCLIKHKPADRPLPAQIVQHPWLANRLAAVSDETLKKTMSNISQSRESSNFHALCIACTALHLDHHSVDGMHQVFHEIDQDDDGKLDLMEFQHGLERISGSPIPQKELSQIFAFVDTDGSGHIDYCEFIAAAFGNDNILDQKNALYKAFKAIDVNDNGIIEKDEIKNILMRTDVRNAWTTEVCEAASEDLISQCAGESRNGLNFDDFLKMLRMVERQGKASGRTPLLPPRSSMESTKVAWVSVDSVSGSIEPYPPEVSRVLEFCFQKKEQCVFLGKKVRGYDSTELSNATVVFKDNEKGDSYQVTRNGDQTGCRDVRRVVMQSGDTMISLNIAGDRGTLHFSDRGYPTSFTGLDKFAVDAEISEGFNLEAELLALDIAMPIPRPANDSFWARCCSIQRSW